jgi:hypothetical protein
MIHHGPSGRPDLVSTEISGPWRSAVRTERMDDETVVAAPVLNSLAAELLVSLVLGWGVNSHWIDS